MKDPNKPGDELVVVKVVEVFAVLELVGGFVALFSASQTSVDLTGTLPTATSEHDWLAGMIYLAAAVFISALLFGFAHIIQDVHDMKRRMKVLVAQGESAAPAVPPTPPPV